ncbi:beta-ketoacyl-ACP synthase III [Enterococcus sp. LJL98]
MMKFGKIAMTASYVPEKIVTNEQLSEIMDTSDEWIYSRTGIKERHIATDENTSDLCIQVAKDLLDKSQTRPEEIDFILVATMSPDYNSPSVACLVQGAIGAVNALAFDLSAACAGFVYALSMGEKLIRTGSGKGLIIGGEVISKVLDWQDRSTAVLFGDGAGGVLLEPSDTQHLIKESIHADGSRAMSLTSGYVNGHNNPYRVEQAPKNACLSMVGRDIFDFATRDVVQSLAELVEEDKEAIDYFLLHQANSRILDKISRKLQVERHKFLQNVEKYGNTSAATIPILLNEAVEAGTLKLGTNQTVVLSGFGGGLTWASMLLTL